MSEPTDTLDPMTAYVIEQIAEGRTLHAIGDELGTSAGTLFSRCTANQEARRRYWLARETATDLLESELLETARFAESVHSLQDAKAARVKCSTLQWLIEKRAPHRYGAKLALDLASTDGSMSPVAAPVPIDAALVQALVDKLTD